MLQHAISGFANIVRVVNGEMQGSQSFDELLGVSPNFTFWHVLVVELVGSRGIPDLQSLTAFVSHEFFAQVEHLEVKRYPLTSSSAIKCL